ncbi:substrate-binding domain-containing protein, partial [Bacillus sp. S34]|nr:substrate-binding domain-containing protein [Bacillus sp. S34]
PAAGPVRLRDRVPRPSAAGEREPRELHRERRGHRPRRERLRTGARPVARLGVRARAAGTRDALRDAGLPSEPYRIQHGDWLEQWGWDATDKLIASGVRVDGIVAGNDQIARGALDQLASRSIAVP